MEKVLKNIIYIIVLSFVFSCKTDPKTTTNSETEKLHSEVIDTAKTIQKSKFETKNPNCLKESDSLEVKIFRKELTNAIIQKDTLAILDFVQLSDMDKNISIEKKKESLQIYFEPIMELCFKEVMPEYAIETVKGFEYFSENKDSKNDCFIYKISNNFPELEFKHIFIFEKVDGEIKLVAIETIG
jgi:hypothetical protein